MLVVISCILLLSSLTAPAITKSLERANAVKCLSNLRSMGQAVQIFTLENQGRFPPALVSDGGGTVMGWDFFIFPNGEVEPGWIWRDYGVNQILQCPSFRGAGNWRGDPHTGYNYNSSYLGGMKTVVRDRVMQDTPSASVFHLSNPARTAVFGDGEYAAGANKFMRSPLPGPLDGSFAGREGGTQGFRHQGGTHVVFADGHVARREYPGTPAPYASRVGPGTGFLSLDNSLYGGD